MKTQAPRLPLKLADGSLRAAEPRAFEPESEDKVKGAAGAGADKPLSRKQQRRREKALKETAKDVAATAARAAKRAAKAAEEAGEGSDDESQSDPDEEAEAEGASAPAIEAASYEDFASLSPAEAEVRRAELKLLIADLCESIIADPEHNVREATAREVKQAQVYATLKGGKPANSKDVKRRLEGKRKNTLLELHRLCSDMDPVVRQLAMVSCVMVFRDIIPTYRIRLPTPAERQAGVRVSKDVKKLRDFESALLTGYQRFLRYLEATVHKGEKASSRIARGEREGSAAAADMDAEDEGDEDGEEGEDGDADFEEDARYDPAADALGAAKDGSSAGAAAAAAAKGPRLQQREFNAIKMQEKRARKAAALGVEFYAAPDAQLSSLAGSAVRCMCELLKSLPHFNFRANLVAFVVPRMAAREADVAALCRSCVSEVFATDAAGEASHEIVRAINSLVKTSSKRRGGFARLQPPVLAVLRKLRLQVLEKSSAELSREGQLREARKAGKKARKGTHHGENPFDERDVLAGFEAADAEGLDERRRTAAATLRDALNIFFRVLRTPAAQHLLPPVLQGLARFGHLIDVGVTSDLIFSLRDLLQRAAATGSDDVGVAADDEGEGGAGAGGRSSGGGAAGAAEALPPDVFGLRAAARRAELASDGTATGAGAALGLGAAVVLDDAAEAEAAAAAAAGTAAGSRAAARGLTTDAVFNCVLTALRILSGPGELLNADDAEFVSASYAALLRLLGDAHTAAAYTSVPLAIEAVTALFLEKRREYSFDRVAAFARRCLLVALHMPAPAALALISLVRQLMGKYPALRSMVTAPPSAAAASASATGAAGGVLPAGFTADSFSGGGAYDGAAGAGSGAAAGGKKKRKGKGADAAAAWAAASMGDRHLDGLAAGAGAAVRLPEAAAALHSTLWPLVLLAESHFHPEVREAAEAALSLAPALPSQAPAKVFVAFDDRTGKFTPGIAAPREHPLAMTAATHAAAAAKAAAAAVEASKTGGAAPAKDGAAPAAAEAKPQWLGFLKAKPVAPWLLASLSVPPQAPVAAASASSDAAAGEASMRVEPSVFAGAAALVREELSLPQPSTTASAAAAAAGAKRAGGAAAAAATPVAAAESGAEGLSAGAANAASASVEGALQRPSSIVFMLHYMERMQRRNKGAEALFTTVQQLHAQQRAAGSSGAGRAAGHR
jgi:hypothetical protein